MFALSPLLKLIVLAIPIGFVVLRFADWTAEYLWFDAIGYGSVFWTVREFGIVSFLIGFVAALSYFWINLKIFVRLADLGSVVAALNAQFTGQIAPPFPSSLQRRLAGRGRLRTPLPLIAIVARNRIFLRSGLL